MNVFFCQTLLRPHYTQKKIGIQNLRHKFDVDIHLWKWKISESEIDVTPLIFNFCAVFFSSFTPNNLPLAHFFCLRWFCPSLSLIFLLYILRLRSINNDFREFLYTLVLIFRVETTTSLLVIKTAIQDRWYPLLKVNPICLKPTRIYHFRPRGGLCKTFRLYRFLGGPFP